MRPRARGRVSGGSYPTKAICDLVPFPFREVHSIAFDQLLAPVAHYMPRGEIERCFAESGLRLASLRWHHANSWAAHGYL